jgi:hypothetical protein
MPIAQIWKNKRVSSPYILESVECNMCEQQNKNRDAYDKICTKQREVHTNTHNWAAPVRPVTLTGQTGQA